MSRPKCEKRGSTATGESKSKKEKATEQDLAVFVFRLPAADRDVQSQAAGPGEATKVARGAILAAANGDTKIFQRLSARAKANLK